MCLGVRKGSKCLYPLPQYLLIALIMYIGHWTLPPFLFTIQACRVLHSSLCDDYNAAIVLAFSNSIKKYCMKMDAEYSKASSTSGGGLEGWGRIAESIVREASTELRGWTISESLRDNYLQPLRDHGDVLSARMVSREWYYLLVCVLTCCIHHWLH